MSLSLYVHIPFCASKCVYCDFTSGYKPEKKLVDDYVGALTREIGIFTERYPDKTSLSTIYIGGGTPSLLEKDQMETLFGSIRKIFSGRPSETTLEANPDDVNSEKARIWKDLGIDRLSLGIQSMEANILEMLGRRNTPDQNRRSVSLLRSEGFTNVSIDWIAGVRGEDPDKNTGEMMSLEPEHVSVYQLTPEDKTLLGQRVKKGQYMPLDDDESVRSYWKTAEALASRGYNRYEISNYARAPEFASRHNLNYWDRGEYIGVGLGASGFVKGKAGGARWTNHTSFREYFGALNRMELPAGQYEDLDLKTAYREFVMLGLRKTEGVRFRDFTRYFGKEFYSVFDSGRILKLSEFLASDEAGVHLTDAGVNLANWVIREIWEAIL